MLNKCNEWLLFGSLFKWTVRGHFEVSGEIWTRVWHAVAAMKMSLSSLPHLLNWQLQLLPTGCSLPTKEQSRNTKASPFLQDVGLLRACTFGRRTLTVLLKTLNCSVDEDFLLNHSILLSFTSVRPELRSSNRPTLLPHCFSQVCSPNTFLAGLFLRRNWTKQIGRN